MIMWLLHYKFINEHIIKITIIKLEKYLKNTFEKKNFNTFFPRYLEHEPHISRKPIWYVLWYSYSKYCPICTYSHILYDWVLTVHHLTADTRCWSPFLWTHNCMRKATKKLKIYAFWAFPPFNLFAGIYARTMYMSLYMNNWNFWSSPNRQSLAYIYTYFRWDK